MKIGDKAKVIELWSVFHGEIVELVKETDTEYFFTNDNHKRGRLIVAKESVDDYVDWSVKAMTIDEAIKHCEEVTDSKCDECGAEHKQLAEWLKELKEKKEKCKWIKYDYRTMCPEEHNIDNPYWRIPENYKDVLKYCPYCGKEIEYEWERDEDGRE